MEGGGGWGGGGVEEGLGLGLVEHRVETGGVEPEMLRTGSSQAQLDAWKLDALRAKILIYRLLAIGLGYPGLGAEPIMGLLAGFRAEPIMGFLEGFRAEFFTSQTANQPASQQIEDRR